MTLIESQQAVLTARCGAMRCGATRCGFVPKDTRGFFYVWSQVVKALTTWTLQRS